MDNLLGRDDEDFDEVHPDNDGEAPAVVPMPGLGGVGLGGPGVGVGGFPVGGLADDAGAGADTEADIADSPDSFSGGGATSPGRDKNADLLDR